MGIIEESDKRHCWKLNICWKALDHGREQGADESQPSFTRESKGHQHWLEVRYGFRAAASAARNPINDLIDGAFSFVQGEEARLSMHGKANRLATSSSVFVWRGLLFY
jgi:hypothetical protein